MRAFYSLQLDQQQQGTYLVHPHHFCAVFVIDFVVLLLLFLLLAVVIVFVDVVAC